MQGEKSGPWVIMVVSFLVALVVAVYPLSGDFGYLRPELVCMLVIYWIMHSPQHLGLLFAWVVGLIQDVVETGVWGAHAMALTLLAYICLMSYQRIRNYSVWHQSLWVFVLVGTHQVVVNWVQGMAGYRTPVHLLLLPTAMSALLWPVMIFLFLRLRLRYRTS